MRKTRKNIPKSVKEYIKRRDKTCTCCLEMRGLEYHHVHPHCAGGTNSDKNIILLCEEHHKLLHLGDLSTCIAILEYVYFLHHWKLPSDTSELEKMLEFIKINYTDDK